LPEVPHKPKAFKSGFLFFKNLNMKTKIEIKSIFGKVLFEFEKEDNSIKETLKEAVNSGADLHGAYLRGADLHGANLRGVDLHGADLHGADLHGAYLRGVDLHGADLYGADLHGANLRGVDLHGADLHGADLYGADLHGANLYGADLHGADLRGVDLHEAKEINIEKIKSWFWLTPEEGSFVAWKKAANNCVCKLEIPSEAKRISNSKNRKCRAEFVKTLLILDSEGQQLTEVCGNRDSNTIYKVGELTYPDKFDDDIFEDCSHGIHFFITKQEAIDWNN
jgi:hypothetical protein